MSSYSFAASWLQPSGGLPAFLAFSKDYWCSPQPHSLHLLSSFLAEFSFCAGIGLLWYVVLSCLRMLPLQELESRPGIAPGSLHTACPSHSHNPPGESQILTRGGRNIFSPIGHSAHRPRAPAALLVKWSTGKGGAERVTCCRAPEVSKVEYVREKSTLLLCLSILELICFSIVSASCVWLLSLKWKTSSLIISPLCNDCFVVWSISISEMQIWSPLTPSFCHSLTS